MSHHHLRRRPPSCSTTKYGPQFQQRQFQLFYFWVRLWVISILFLWGTTTAAASTSVAVSTTEISADEMTSNEINSSLPDSTSETKSAGIASSSATTTVATASAMTAAGEPANNDSPAQTIPTTTWETKAAASKATATKNNNQVQVINERAAVFPTTGTTEFDDSPNSSISSAASPSNIQSKNSISRMRSTGNDNFQNHNLSIGRLDNWEPIPHQFSFPTKTATTTTESWSTLSSSESTAPFQHRSGFSLNSNFNNADYDTKQDKNKDQQRQLGMNERPDHKEAQLVLSSSSHYTESGLHITSSTNRNPAASTDVSDKNDDTDEYSAHHPYHGCQEIFVGGGWGGIYSFYRRVLHAVEKYEADAAKNQTTSSSSANKKNPLRSIAHSFCFMEQSSRVGGRTYSVPMSHRHTGGKDRFVLEIGSNANFAPNMALVHDLIVHHFQFPTANTACSHDPADDTNCGADQQNNSSDPLVITPPPPFLMSMVMENQIRHSINSTSTTTTTTTTNATEVNNTLINSTLPWNSSKTSCSPPLPPQPELRRMVDDRTQLPIGYATVLQRMVETCQWYGARIFYQTKLVQITIPMVKQNMTNDHTFELVFEDTTNGIRSSVLHRIPSQEQPQTTTDSEEDENNDAEKKNKMDKDDKDDGSTNVEVVVLNLPRHKLLQVHGVRQALDPNVLKTLECIVLDQDDEDDKDEEEDEDESNKRWKAKHKDDPTEEEDSPSISSFGKAYLYYNDAWWITKLNQTNLTSSWPVNSTQDSKPVRTPQGYMFKVKWHEGPVKCRRVRRDDDGEDEGEASEQSFDPHNHKQAMIASTPSRPLLEILTSYHNTSSSEEAQPQTCRGFLEIYYAFDHTKNETFYNSLPSQTAVPDEENYPHKIQDPLGMLWVQDSPLYAPAELQRLHQALMEFLDPLFVQQAAVEAKAAVEAHMAAIDANPVNATTLTTNATNSTNFMNATNVTGISDATNTTIPSNQIPTFNVTNAMETLTATLSQKMKESIQPPLGIVVGIWQRPNHKLSLKNKNLGWTVPTKVIYDPQKSGIPYKACGKIQGLNDETYRHTVLQPFHIQPDLFVKEQEEGLATSNETSDKNKDEEDDGPKASSTTLLPRIFVVNNDFVCSHVKYYNGDWAEESVLQAERAMYLLQTPKPKWIQQDWYYEQFVVEPAQSNITIYTPSTYKPWITTKVEDVPGMEAGPMVALGVIVAVALLTFVLELWRRFPSSRNNTDLFKWNSDGGSYSGAGGSYSGTGGSRSHHHQQALRMAMDGNATTVAATGPAGGTPKDMMLMTGNTASYFGDIDDTKLKRADENGGDITSTTTAVPGGEDDKLIAPGGGENENGEEEDEEEIKRRTALEVLGKDALNLWRWQNLAIPVSYWVGGTSAGMFRTFLNVYPLDIGANEAQQTTCATLAALPAAFKILYGFTSDTNPIYGYRRKPYLFLGWFLAAMTMMFLMATSTLTLERERLIEDREDGKERVRDVVIVPENAPSLLKLSTCFFLFGFGMWFANAMTDALVAEKAKYEPEAIRGTLQSTCYLMRFFGLMVSAPISTYLYSKVGPQIIVQCLVWVPFLVLPLLWFLAEPKVVVKSVKEQCHEIWITVCSRSVWEPMAFMYLFNLLQVSNAAWRQFLVTVLGFTPANLNTLLVVSYVLVYLGTMLYKYCLLQTSWRLIYQGCLVMNLVLSSMQLLLIRGITFGISPFIFALGDDAFAEFLNGIQFLPAVIMMVSLCPTGSEGVSYATFTTVMNSSWMISNSISSLLLGIWDVSRETMEQGKLDGMFKLSLLTSCIQFTPLFFMGWLPHGRKELEELASQPYSGSVVGGRTFLCVLFGSMTLTLIVSILNITVPGWAGGS